MKNKIYLATTAIVLMMAPSSYANTNRFFSATNCIGSTAADNNIVTRLSNGCFNTYSGFYSPDGPTCAPLATVALPITGNNSATVDYDTVNVDFVNASQGESISCTIYVQNSAGTVFASSTLSTVVASSPTVPVRGTLTWTGANLPNLGSAITNVRTQTIFCTIPSRIFEVGENCFGVTNFSAVIGYSVNTVGS